MSRVIIDFPPEALFETEVSVHHNYINAANHVGNEGFVSLLNEAAMRYFQSRLVQPYTIGKQVLINTEMHLQLKSEAHRGDLLRVELAAGNFHRKGCEFIYRVSQMDTGKVVVLATFSYLIFDYQAGKVVEADENFADFFVSVKGNGQ